MSKRIGSVKRRGRPKKNDELEELETALELLTLQGERMALDFARLEAAVTANTAAVNAAVAAGVGGGTPANQASIDAAAATIEANNSALTAATPTT
jgi:hypothetical protein